MTPGMLAAAEFDYIKPVYCHDADSHIDSTNADRKKTKQKNKDKERRKKKETTDNTNLFPEMRADL